MLFSKLQGNGATPVVANDRGPAIRYMKDELPDILTDNGWLVVLNSFGFIAEVVTPHIGHNDAEVLSQSRYLFAPAIPELGKTVQQDNHRAFPCLYIVEPDTVDVDVIVNNVRKVQCSKFHVDEGFEI